MKRFLFSGLILCVGGAGMAQTYYLTGHAVGWAEPGTAGSLQMVLNGSTGLYEATFSNLTPGENYTFKVFNGAGWGGGFGNDSRIRANSSSMKVTFNADAAASPDGWLAASGHRVGFVTETPRTFEVVGSFNGWSTPIAMSYLGNGRYETTEANLMAPNTSYEFKFRETSTPEWQASIIGPNFGEPNNITFTTDANWGTTSFLLDTNNGRYNVVPEPASMAALGLGILGLARRRRNK